MTHVMSDLSRERVRSNVKEKSRSLTYNLYGKKNDGMSLLVVLALQGGENKGDGGDQDDHHGEHGVPLGGIAGPGLLHQVPDIRPDLTNLAITKILSQFLLFLFQFVLCY